MGAEGATDVSTRDIRYYRSRRERVLLGAKLGMHSTDGWDSVDRALGFVTLTWSTADEVDHSLQWKKWKTSGRRVSAGECFGIENKKRVVGAVHVAGANVSVQPFSLELAWSRS